MPRRCTCKHCGQEFTPHKTSPGIYCSNRCRALWQRGERSNRYKGGTTTLNCAQCQAPFEAFPYEVRNGRKLCSDVCRVAYQKAEHAPSWKGGRYIDPQGYVVIHRPDHPRASAKGKIHEHVEVAEAMLGRLLAPDEAVHHMDRNRANNDPSNLQVMTRSEHNRLHALELAERRRAAKRLAR